MTGFFFSSFERYSCNSVSQVCRYPNLLHKLRDNSFWLPRTKQNTWEAPDQNSAHLNYINKTMSNLNICLLMYMGLTRSNKIELFIFGCYESSLLVMFFNSYNHNDIQKFIKPKSQQLTHAIYYTHRLLFAVKTDEQTSNINTAIQCVVMISLTVQTLFLSNPSSLPKTKMSDSHPV